MNASATSADLPDDPGAEGEPADRGERQVRDGPASETADRVPRAVAEVVGIDRRGLRRRRPAAGGTTAPTAHSTRISAGSNPLPNGSNHTFGLNVSRPHNRGVGSCNRAAVKARAYSRALEPDQEGPRQVEREPDSCVTGTMPVVDPAVDQAEAAARRRRVRVSAASDPSYGLRGVLVGARMDLTDRLPASSRSPILRPDHEPDGGVDRVALADPARAQRDARRSDRLSIHAAERTGPGRPRSARRPGAAAARAAGSSTTRGSPPCACDHRAEPLERLSAVQRVLGPRHRLAVRRFPGRLERPRREQRRRGPAADPRNVPAQQLDRLRRCRARCRRRRRAAATCPSRRRRRHGPIRAPATGTPAPAPRRPRASS